MAKLDLASVNLVSCDFKLLHSKKQNELYYLLALLDYQGKKRKNKGNFVYTATLGFDLMHRVLNPQLSFKCSFELKYECDEEGWERLKNHIVVAHAVTYLREFVSNITMRTSVPTMIIKPVNAIKLWQDYQEAQGQGSAAG